MHAKEAARNTHPAVPGVQELTSVYIGTVIASARRYVALERRHGIQLDDNQPRIVGGQLQFLCRRFGFTELDAPLKEVRLDLTTLDCEVRVVPVAAVNATALP